MFNSSFYFYEMFSKHLNLRPDIYNLSLMMLNLCLLEHRMNNFRPSVLALAVIYLSVSLYKLDYEIIDLIGLIDSNEQQIKNCSLDIFFLFHKIKTPQKKDNQLHAVFRKFSQNKYYNVGLINISGPNIGPKRHTQQEKRQN